MRLRISGEGPLVVKLAGLAGGTGLLGEEAEAVARSGFRVAALDTAGDRADDPAPIALTWEFLAAEVCRGLDTLGAARAILWGTSFGCLVALATAARAPDRVAGLLLSNPPNPYQRPRWQRRAIAWIESRRDPARIAGTAFRVGFRALAGWEVLYPTTLIRLPALYRANAEAATPSATVLQKLRLLDGEPPGLPPPGARIPVTILAARWDTATPAGEARGLAGRLDGARLRSHRFSGHFVSCSRPRAAARAAVEELRWLTTGFREDSG